VTAAEILKLLVQAVGPAGIDYAVGGGAAVNAHGVARYTADVDAFFRPGDRGRVLKTLREAGFQVDRVFAPHHYIALPPGASGVKERVDVLFAEDEPEASAIDHPVQKTLWGTNAPTFPVELLVMAKFYANQPLDLWDIQALHDAGAFEPATVRALLAIVDPDAVKEFDEIARLLVESRKPRKRPSKRQ